MAKIINLLKFSVKYEFKRSILYFVLIAALLIFAQGNLDNVVKQFNKASIIDRDNSMLSHKFVEFIKNKTSIQSNNDTLNKIIIPKNFSTDYYYLGNATIYSNILTKTDIYEFQLKNLNESIRIDVRPIEDRGNFSFAVFMLILMISGMSVNFLVSARKNGKIYFISNHFNFWLLLLTNNLLMIFFIIYMIYTGVLSINTTILMTIIILFLMIINFKFRNNPKVADNNWLINFTILIILYLLYINGIVNIPIANLLTSEFNYLVVIDIVILLFLVFVVSKLKLTEK